CVRWGNYAMDYW
nr:immunoglobulin heavy chain junction region [Mus musculus]